jgi:carboxylate-amine ligase
MRPRDGRASLWSVSVAAERETAPDAKAVPARRHRFRPGNEYSLGVEEELVLVGGDELAPVPLVARIVAAVGDPEHVKPELMRCQLELATPPCRTSSEVLDALRALRVSGRLAAALYDARLVAAGTHPVAIAEEEPITDNDRYRELIAELRYPVRRELCCGMHVHVAVGGAEKACHVVEALVPDLPLLLALSASSPFWRGKETGLASTRTIVFQSMPRSGLPPVLGTYEAFADGLDRLAAAGAVADHSHLWWDVRPHPRFGTVEVRVMDVQPRAVDSAAIAGLVQALVRHHGCAYERGARAAPASRWLVSENRWLAARHGLRARLVRLDGDRGQASARELVLELVERLEEDADAVGAGWALAHVAGLVHEGTSADRQLSAYRESRSFRALLAGLAQETGV